jgi:Protein of unknown function DUF45
MDSGQQFETERRLEAAYDIRDALESSARCRMLSKERVGIFNSTRHKFELLVGSVTAIGIACDQMSLDRAQDVPEVLCVPTSTQGRSWRAQPSRRPDREHRDSMRRARLSDLTPAARLRRRVDHWAMRLRVMPRIVRVQRMTRKWGSCSRSGILSLAADLDDRDKRFQDFVIVHELLHIRIPNHGRLFKALMTAHVPHWRSLEADSGTRRFSP